MAITRRTAISGLASAIRIDSISGGPASAGIAEYRVGPGTALTGGILAQLGFAATAEAEIGSDPTGKLLVEQARGLSPELFLLDRTAPGVSTFQFLSSTGEDCDAVVPAGDSAPGLRDLPLGGSPERAVGIWCYPEVLVARSEELEEEFSARLARHAERGVTQVLAVGRPHGARRNSGSWQEWLRAQLPSIDVLCSRADHLLELLDPNSAAALASEGRLKNLPTWLTGRTLHDLSGYLLSCGLGVAAIGLGEHGVYLRTAADSARIAFSRKFAPDDQLAAHMAMWTERDMLIPLFETTYANAYSATDALTAGCVASLLRGKSPGDTLRIASAVVSFSREAKDPLADIPPLDVVEARVDGGWEQAHCRLDLSGWSDE